MAATLVEQTYDNLLNMIIEKEIRPGERLPSEMILCDMFDVSRNTLRAAINKLGVLGFTETRQGGGTYVKEVDSDVYLNFFVPALLTHNVDLLSIMQFRKGIEVEATRLAAAQATEEDMEELKELLEQCKSSRQSMREFASANTDLHYCIAKSSHNKMFEKMMEIIRIMILPEMQNFLAVQGSDIDSTFYHEMILKCIIDHKPDEAAYFMERHMTVVMERVEEYVVKKR